MKNCKSSGTIKPKSEAVVVLVAPPPDGGWGWVVVFAAFLTLAISDGIQFTIGVFYEELLRDFDEGHGTTSWVASIMVANIYLVGPVASALTNKFGFRVVAILGSLMTASGFILSSFASSVKFLYFSIGMITGPGLGMMYLPSVVCVSNYFEQRRALATGVSVCGSGVGTILLAPLIDCLVGLYGWRGAMLLVAGIVLHGCVFAMLYRPLRKGNPGVRKGGAVSKSAGAINVKDKIRSTSLTVQNGRMTGISYLAIDHPEDQNANFFARKMRSVVPLPRRRRLTFPFTSREAPKKVLPELLSVPDQRDGHQRTSFGGKASRFFGKLRNCREAILSSFADLDFANLRLLLADAVFLAFVSTNFLAHLGYGVPYVYTDDRAVGLGLADEGGASLLISYMGAANTAGRLLVGCVADRCRAHRLWLFSGSLVLAGLATSVSAACRTYVAMALYGALYGAAVGAYSSLKSTILVDLIGLEKLTNAFGLLLMFQGIANLIGPPVTGWLYDYTGSYDLGFIAMGISITIGGAIVVFIPCLQRRSKYAREQVADIELQSASRVSTKDYGSTDL